MRALAPVAVVVTLVGCNNRGCLLDDECSTERKTNDAGVEMMECRGVATCNYGDGKGRQSRPLRPFDIEPNTHVPGFPPQSACADKYFASHPVDPYCAIQWELGPACVPPDSSPTPPGPGGPSGAGVGVGGSTGADRWLAPSGAGGAGGARSGGGHV